MIQHVGGSSRSNDPRSLLCLTAAECALVDEGIRTGWDAGDHCCSGGGCQRITTGGRRRDEGQRPEKAASGSRQNAHRSKASHLGLEKSSLASWLGAVKVLQVQRVYGFTRAFDVARKPQTVLHC